MHKILNWTLGGFFRTIGRTIAFLVIGGLIAYICIKLDVKLPRGLAWSVVHAESWLDLNNPPSSGYLRTSTNLGSFDNLYILNANTPQNTSNITFQYNQSCNVNGATNNGPDYFLSTEHQYHFVYQYGDGTHDVFSNWLNVANNFEIQFYNLFDTLTIEIYDNTCTKIIDPVLEDWFIDYDISISVNDTDVYPVYYFDYYFVPKQTIGRVVVRSTFDTASTLRQTKYWYQSKYRQVYDEDLYVPPVNDLVGNITAEISGRISDITDELTDIVDGTVEVYWFNNYEIESEHFLSGIVKLPLDLINSIMLEEYYPICATLKGKQVCLPSGDIMWRRTNTNTWFGTANYTAFKEFFNLFVGGIAIFYSLRSLWFTLEKILNPVHNSTEVMKL